MSSTSPDDTPFRVLWRRIRKSIVQQLRKSIDVPINLHRSIGTKRDSRLTDKGTHIHPTIRAKPPQLSSIRYKANNIARYKKYRYAVVLFVREIGVNYYLLETIRLKYIRREIESVLSMIIVCVRVW